MSRLKQAIAFLLTLTLAIPSQAQALDVPGSELYDLGLEELMKVNIASRDSVSQAEAPGIISVITRDEIRTSGARNLIDVLMMVPGFQFASDYNGTVSLGVRGLWALEGKVLLMVDGVDMNDLFYNSNFYFYAFPVNQISRIEVIRGPGSVIYGGAAEYAVINIATLGAGEIKGASVTYTHGNMKSGMARDAVGLMVGKKFGNDPDDLEIAFKAFSGKAGITDRGVTYPTGDVFSEDFSQKIENYYASVKYKGLTARFYSEDVRAQARDLYFSALASPSEFRFTTSVAQLEYEWKVSDRFKITPTLTHKRSAPYVNSDPYATDIGGGSATTEVNFNYKFERYRVLLPASYRITDKLKLLFGSEIYRDEGIAPFPAFALDPGNPTDLSPSMHIHSTAAFGELFWQSDWGTFSAGGRLEEHSKFDGYFVPRFSWTKVYDEWNFKLLYSEAFRTPSIGNIYFAQLAGNTIKPERTNVVEAEIGRRFGKHTSAVLSLFDMRTRDTIVYDAMTFGYNNGDRAGTYGAELELKNTGSWGFSNLAVSFHNAVHNEVDRYQVPQDRRFAAGFSDYKITWNTKYIFTKNFSVQPSFIYLGKRYGFHGDTDGDLALDVKAYDPVLTTNLFATYENLGLQGLDLTAGAANVFNTDSPFLTSYDLGRNTLPGPTTEFLIRLNYKWEF